MFIKPFPKYNNTTKQRYTIYRLCESYRRDGCIRHRTIIGFGKLDELPEENQKKQLASRVEEMLKHGPNHFDLGDVDRKVEELARYFYTEIIKKRRYDVKQDETEWETVDMGSMKNNDARDVGTEWLCKQAFDQMGINYFLMQCGWSGSQASLAATHIISRAVYPASELKTARYIKENSAVCELTGFDREKINKDRLYAISHKLHSVKDQLEQYLSIQTNELFDLEDNKREGIYFIRTSLKETNERTLWLIYNTIREIESTFRILKTDLDLRPIYHKDDDASMAHLHLGLLAYWLVATIRHHLKQKGFNSDWREIRRIMSTQKCVATSLRNINDQAISIRKCTGPTSKTKQIYNLLGYKHAPFYRKKSVVPPGEIFKIDSS